MRMSAKRLNSLSSTVASLIESYQTTAISHKANDIKKDIGALRCCVREAAQVADGSLEAKRNEAITELQTVVESTPSHTVDIISTLKNAAGNADAMTQ